MSASQQGIYIGIDSGATTSKIGAVWQDGATVSQQLLQRSTLSTKGPQATTQGWVDAVGDFLQLHKLTWEQMLGVGLAIPGPYIRYGVIGRAANLPASFEGFDVHASLTAAIAAKIGRNIPVIVGNDGNYGGVAEAQHVRGTGGGTVLMLAPGSGLGAAYIDRHGLPLDGDTLAGMEAGHMPAPLHELGIKPFPCGCGRTWGCIEAYTTLSGLPHLLAEFLPKYPNHELAASPLAAKEKVLALRGLAQKGDALAAAIFDFQARALGYHVAILAMALDPSFVVIGGGLMDPEATTPAFREHYLQIVRDTAKPFLWASQRDTLQVVPATLGDLSQAIGAALVALYEAKSK